jgi:hypothetical protein
LDVQPILPCDESMTTETKDQVSQSDSRTGGLLAGIRVIEFASVIMAPYATQQLGDLGADVIKIEPPGGDMTRPGVIGNHPSLTDLDEGDLKFNVDFRSVYAAVLEDWLGANSQQVLGKPYRKAKIVKA